MKRPIFWDFKRSFIGLPAIIPMATQAIGPLLGVFGAMYLLEYHFTSFFYNDLGNTYYDQYDGDVTEHMIGQEVFHHKTGKKN